MKRPRGSSRRAARAGVSALVILLSFVSMVAFPACGGSQTAVVPLPTPTATGTIAFMSVVKSGEGGDADIYLVDADGTGLKRLTDDPGWEESPSWSPDGSRIAYTVYAKGSTEGYDATVWVMNADGSGKQQLVKGSDRGDHPSWSPDGTQIVFRRMTRKQPFAASIFVMNADGSGLSQVTSDERDMSPIWAPDGRILFLRSGDVFSVKPDGSGLVQLTKLGDLANGNVDDYVRIGDYALSPDGQTIALHDGTNDRIVAITAQGNGTPTTLLDRLSRYFSFSTFDKNVAPAWAPDGKALALATSYFFGLSGSRLYVMNADGSGLSAVPGIDKAIAPAWRPRWTAASPTP